MLESISLKFTELFEPLRVPTQGVTVFVGPNNSGKSLVLREIEQDVSSHATVATKLLNDFEIVWSSEQQLEEDLVPGITVD
jgi:predicted ATP-dependent endonuclease of OLD family